MRYLILTVTTLFLTYPAILHAAPPAQSPIIGVWETERKEDENKVAHVRISPCQDNRTNLCGHIVWLEEPLDPETGKPKLDKKNSDVSKQNQPVMGMQMMWHFKPVNNSMTKYKDGTLYSAATGKTYDGEMELKDPNTLSLTGYVLFFWKSQTWKRVKGK